MIAVTQLDWIQFAGLVVVGLTSLMLAVTYLASRVRRQTDAERNQLLDLKTDRITELEHKVENLTNEVARLTGMFQALQTLKASEIAYEVAAMLRDAGIQVPGGAAGR